MSSTTDRTEIHPLADIRTDRNLTQGQLSKLSGVGLRTIYRIENWKAMGSLLTRKRLAKALNCKVETITREPILEVTAK